MLNCSHLTVAYRNRPPVLKDVSLTVPDGAVTALLGVNGAGKTTLFKAILQEIAYTGLVFCDNTDLSVLSYKERAKRISLLPQQLPNPALSVRETVALGLSPHVAKLGSAEWARVDTALARVGITDLAARLVSALSGGERQKVFLALLLAQSTPVLLLDEPTSHMDLAFIPQFYGILREEAAAGKAILLITHDVTEAFSNADRVALLANGSLAFSGTTAEALEQEIPEKHFRLTRYVAQRGEKTAVFFKTE